MQLAKQTDRIKFPYIIVENDPAAKSFCSGLHQLAVTIDAGTIGTE